MTNSYELVYVNNQMYGHFEDNVFLSYSKEEKKEILSKLEKEIARKDHNRKRFSTFIGLTLLMVAIIIAILMLCKVFTLGTGQWFNYTYLVTFLFVLWLALYYLFGFFFYKKVKVNFYFKSHKSNNINSCVTFASSNYQKWMDKYLQYLKQTNFVIPKKSKKKDILLPFGIKAPSTFKNFIFNGSIKCNVPYYYLSVQNKKYLFLPGMIVLVDGKESKVFEIEEFKVVENKKTYHFYNNDKLLLSFKCQGDFNINFFYFKYEQL